MCIEKHVTVIAKCKYHCIISEGYEEVNECSEIVEFGTACCFDFRKRITGCNMITLSSEFEICNDIQSLCSVRCINYSNQCSATGYIETECYYICNP